MVSTYFDLLVNTVEATWLCRCWTRLFSVENRLIDITMPLWNTYSHIYHNSLALENYFQNLMVRHVQFYNTPKKSILRNHNIGNFKKASYKIHKESYEVLSSCILKTSDVPSSHNIKINNLMVASLKIINDVLRHVHLEGVKGAPSRDYRWMEEGM